MACLLLETFRKYNKILKNGHSKENKTLRTAKNKNFQWQYSQTEGRVPEASADEARSQAGL